MKKSDLKKILSEVIGEELQKEINHTVDKTTGKFTIAVGAPNSQARFKVENSLQNIDKQIYEKLKELKSFKVTDYIGMRITTNQLKNVLEKLKGHGLIEFDGVIATLLPIKENEFQNAYDYSRQTRPLKNDTKKAQELAKQGKYVVVIEYPVHCKFTDGCLGSDIVIQKVCNTKEEADKELPQENRDDDCYYHIIGPENVKPQQKSSTSDDVPFEGVGAVYTKDIKKDPKHIPGERWRVKFEENKKMIKNIIRECIKEHNEEKNMNNPAEKKEVEIARKLKKLVNNLLKMHGKV